MTYIGRHALLFEGIEGEYNLPVALKSPSLRQFDEAFTRGTYFCIILTGSLLIMEAHILIKELFAYLQLVWV